MSSTTLYAINQDGTLSEWTEYRNSHGSAAAVWSICAHKYLDNVAGPGEDWDPSKRHWMLHDEVLTELWQKANAGEIPLADRRVVWTTYDRACVRIEDVPLYAHALRSFAREYGPRQAELGHVFHIGTMADDLDRIYDERHEHGWRGVAWNQTSTVDTWTTGDDQADDNVDVFGCTWLPGAGQETLT